MVWSARRAGAAPWPVPAVMRTASLAGAVQARGAVAGWAFGCGWALDAEGWEREAACEVIGLHLVRLPNPAGGLVGEVHGVVEVESEVRYGPNSYALGRELAGRLSPVEWEYAPGAVAVLEVARVQVSAAMHGPVGIWPERAGVL